MRNLILLFLAIFVVLFIGLEFRLLCYGESYNKKRQEVGLALIDNTWSSRYSIINGEVKFEKHQGNNTIYKITDISLISGIISETDYYLIADKKIAIDATYYFETKKWLIRRYDNRGKMKNLSVEQLKEMLTLNGVIVPVSPVSPDL